MFAKEFCLIIVWNDTLRCHSDILTHTPCRTFGIHQAVCKFTTSIIVPGKLEPEILAWRVVVPRYAHCGMMTLRALAAALNHKFENF